MANVSAPAPAPDMAAVTPVSFLNNGDNSWQLTSATLVGLQTMVGLVMMYGGVVKKKWAINSAFMVMYAYSAVLLTWSICGYRFSFGKYMLPFWGRPGTTLGGGFESVQADLYTAHVTAAYGMATMVYFQGVFAAITLALIAGSLLGRMNFLAWMLFVPLWVVLSYSVGAFSVWGGGFLFKWGVLDYSGGYVIHVSSGTAGYVAAFWLGPRLLRDRERFPPNNIIFVLAGAGMLWLGWNGFNGGDPYTASVDAGIAVLNTNLATAASMLVWTCLDYAFFGKPSVIGAVQGIITGLVVITPGAGFIPGWAAIVEGMFSGSVPWFTMMVLARKVPLLKHIDDTLGVVHTHCVTGILGGFLTGVFTTRDLAASFPTYLPSNGLIQGGIGQVGKQLAGAMFIVGWNIVMTSLIMLFLKLVVPIRMSDEHLEIGDDAAHGEEAYALWGEGLTYDESVHGWYGYDRTTHGERKIGGTEPGTPGGVEDGNGKGAKAMV
ncbi:ammonium transporter 2 [Klebsormidium nitens]|uniref:Ammonium transporter n=2 Tax=Klebsormidium TaxID=3174 RepID=A0A1Y1HTX5_KLENI|nr:ammonium transporter 2 [Klebsormidium nitens]|eukprot:GAQ81292.1 ammonium transporter 2 [Klebsormidium nitens]